jgi:hypothetical protein
MKIALKGFRKSDSQVPERQRQVAEANLALSHRLCPSGKLDWPRFSLSRQLRSAAFPSAVDFLKALSRLGFPEGQRQGWERANTFSDAASRL